MAETYQEKNGENISEIVAELKQDYALLKGQFLLSAEEISILKQKYADLNTVCDHLREKYDELVKKTDERTAAEYELFRSFVDDGREKIILVDAGYAIQYVNRSASEFLKNAGIGSLSGRKIFEFFQYEDALRLKKKIDTAFLDGETEKIKDLRGRNVRGEELKLKLKLKIIRVRYNDKPAIKIVVK